MKIEGIEVESLLVKLPRQRDKMNLDLPPESESFLSIPISGADLALVGPNGSGKTTFLGALQNAFSGYSVDERTSPLVRLMLKVPTEIFDDESSNSPTNPLIYDEHFPLQCLISEAVRNLGLEFGSEYRFVDSRYRSGETFLKEYKANWLSGLSDCLLFVHQVKQYLEGKSEHQNKPVSIPVWFDRDGVRVKNAIEQSVLNECRFMFQGCGSKGSPKWTLWSMVREELDYQDLLTHSPNTNEPINGDSEPVPSKSIRWGDDPWTGQFVQGQIVPLQIDGAIWFAHYLGEFETESQSMGVTVMNPDTVDIDDVSKLILSALSRAFVMNVSESESTSPTVSPDAQRMLSLFEFTLKRLEGFQFPESIEPVDFFTTQDNQTQISKHVSDLLHTVEHRLNSFMSLLLPTWPHLQLSINQPSDWIDKGIVRVGASVDGKPVRLDQLSWVQQRWLKFLVSTYIRENNRDLLWIIDEPERGLQQSLEKSVSGILQALVGKRSGRTVSSTNFIATHSTKFMQSSNLILVESEPVRSYSRMDGGLYSVASTIGLTTSELLSSYKLLLMVEGEHDEAILKGFYGQHNLEADGIRIIPSAGLHSWGYYFGHELSLKSLDTHLVFLIDDWSVDELESILQEVRQKPGLDKRKVRNQLRKTLKEHKPRFNTTSNQADRALYEILCTSLSTQESQVTFLGATTPDILEWLDPKKDYGISNDWDSFSRKVKSKYSRYSAECRAQGRQRKSLGEFWKEELKSAIAQGLRPVNGNPFLPDRLEYLASNARDRSPEYVVQLINRLKELARKSVKA